MSLQGATKNTPIPGGLGNLSPKTMVMIALLAVMGILWGRVLLKGTSGPSTASAQEATVLEALNTTRQVVPVRIDPVVLHQIPGRNDRLSRDFFSSENWTSFGFDHSDSDSRPDSDVMTSEETSERIHRLKLAQIADRLHLEAIIQDADGNPSQVFVDGKILSVGSVLAVQEGPDQYQLRLDEITEKKVVFLWNKDSVVLEMSETFEF